MFDVHLLKRSVGLPLVAVLMNVNQSDCFEFWLLFLIRMLFCFFHKWKRYSYILAYSTTSVHFLHPLIFLSDKLILHVKRCQGWIWHNVRLWLSWSMFGDWGVRDFQKWWFHWGSNHLKQCRRTLFFRALLITKLLARTMLM